MVPDKGAVRGLRAHRRSLYSFSIEFSGGLNVLYGLNGAGKTNVIHTLLACLTGDWYSLNDRRGSSSLACAILAGYPLLAPIREHEEIASAAVSVSKGVLGQGSFADEEAAGQTVAEAIRSTRAFAAFPMGSREDPNWRLVPCVDPDTDELQALVRIQEQATDQWFRYYFNRDGYSQPVEVESDPYADPESTAAYREAVDAEHWTESLLFQSGRNEPWHSDRFLPADGLPILVGQGLSDPLPLPDSPMGIELVVIRELSIAELNRLSQRALGGSKDPAALGHALTERVNEVLPTLLLDHPVLDLDVGKPRGWLARGLPEWAFTLPEGKHSARKGLELLSTAEVKWSSIAVQIAIWELTTDGVPAVLIVDEPEAALHRTSERHMATGLRSLIARSGLQAIIATHSPELLDLQDANTFRVWKDAGRTRVNRLSLKHREQLADFGLQPSDLLPRRKAILLVEGHHEEVIFKELLGDELHRLAVEVLPLHGGRTLPQALESRLLADFTDALLVPIVDNVDISRLASTWEEALVIAAGIGIQEAGDYIRDSLPGKEAIEFHFIGQFMSRALELGVQDRVKPYSFAAADIIEYLPVSAFVPRTSWAALRERHSAAGGTPNFKIWVSRTFGTTFDDRALLAACREMDHIPLEFTELCRFLDSQVGEQ